MKNLNKEYHDVNLIYEQQKEYRSTPEGKIALRRSKERQLLKKMTVLFCEDCGEKEFEVLTLHEDITLCYNCKLRRPKVLEKNEICL